MKSTVTQGTPSTVSLQATSSPAQDSFQHWYDKGETLANAAAYERALRCFEEATILEPDAIAALVYQAVCLIHLEQPAQALGVADRILAIALSIPRAGCIEAWPSIDLGAIETPTPAMSEFSPPNSIPLPSRGMGFPVGMSSSPEQVWK